MGAPRESAIRVYSGPMGESEILAVGAAELLWVLILLCVIVVPIAAVAFARSGKAYSEIGKGRFAVDYDESAQAEHEEELRQLVEAKAYRQARRGERPLDVDSEIERLLHGEEPAAPGPVAPQPDEDPELAQIRAEIRQVAIAKNEARIRRGEEPLDLDVEVQRMLDEFGQAPG